MLRNLLLIGALFLVISAITVNGQAQELTKVDAFKISEQIKNRENIYLENVSIVGEFNLSEKDFKTIPIERKSAGAFFLYSGHEDSFNIKDEQKIVETNIVIINSVFKNNVDLSNIQFKKRIYLSNNQFLNKADFTGTNFDGVASISGSSFSGVTSFWGTNFYDDAYFSNTSFSNLVYFGNTNFNGDVTFRYANFENDVTFSEANFNGEAYFGEVNFNDVGFNDASFNDKSYFSETRFNKVYLKGVDFKNVDIRWDLLENALVFDGETYIKLIQHYRDVEQFDDADNAYYQYRKQSLKDGNVISRLSSGIMWSTCGYGVKPHRALFFGVFIILVSTFIYWWKKGISQLKENEGNEDHNVSFYDAFYFSVVTFTTIGYGDWYPKNHFRILAMVEGLLGWLILALFLVTLTNVMIRP